MVNARDRVHAEILEHISATSRVMKVFSVLPGAPKACMDFRDPTDVSRIMVLSQRTSRKSQTLITLIKQIGLIQGFLRLDSLP